MKMRRRDIRALRLAAQERKASDFSPELYREPEDGENDLDEEMHSCPGCAKARPEPFHCGACSAHSEGPGHG